MITIYHNPRCSKSRQTLGYLKESGESLKIKEYLKDPITASELQDILSKLGIRSQDIIRRNEKLYKELFKGKDLTESQWVQVLVEHPILIERPIVVKDQKAVLGRPPEKVKQLL